MIEGSKDVSQISQSEKETRVVEVLRMPMVVIYQKLHAIQKRDLSTVSRDSQQTSEW